MPKKLLITGKNGQLGSEFKDLASQFPQFSMVFVDREEMDLSSPEQIKAVLENERPDIIINAGAYTAVDKAESEETLCNAINNEAVGVMAAWCYKNDAKIIHISTDYVFNGQSEVPLKETDPTDPINVYGKTKRLGEEALEASGAAFVIIRTAWVYSVYGANFVKTMMRLMNERDTLGIVSDQVGAPTYARDLAWVIMDILNAPEFVQGIYHYSNSGRISWYEFAVAIKEYEQLDCILNAINSDAFPTPARRPSFSLLDTRKIKNTYHIEIPFWKDSLKEMLQHLRNGNSDLETFGINKK